MISKGLILKTAAVVSAVSVLIITGCQGGIDEAAAVNNKSEVKETSVVSEKDREENIEVVVRSNGLTRQDTEDLRDDNKRETASDGRLPEVTVEVKQPEDEGAVTGEEDSGAGTDDNEGQSDESVLSVYESDSSAGWDGGMENDSAVSEYSDSEWYESDSTGVEAEEGFTDEYSDSGVDESGQPDSGESAVPEPEVSVQEYEEPGESLTYLGTWASTGYCPCSICCGQWASGYTASGTLATEGRTVACGSLPMGTTIYIEGWGYRVVEDLGVEGEWVDIFYADHASASAHGLQYVNVYLVN